MILEAVFQVTKEQGLEAVEARWLAKVIWCFRQPIFSQYDPMTY
jgi:hypothetical protein